jgi:hypothetical protein
MNIAISALTCRRSQCRFEAGDRQDSHAGYFLVLEKIFKGGKKERIGCKKRG